MQDFTNDTLNINELPKYEELVFNKLSKKYWRVVLLNIIISLLILAAGLAAFLLVAVTFRPYLYFICGGYLAFSIFLILLYKTALNKRGFAIREKDILYRSGLIAISTTMIPFSRIQHIALDEGLFSRMYQLGQLRIFTAGGSSGSLHIPGIEIEQALQIKALLMKQINELD